jgi:dTDP-4-dehydrorhamnose 3,5-epimerase
MKFKDGAIDGVITRRIKRHSDNRGWLAEVFRSDEIDSGLPPMCYVSMTKPGIGRGPHEHAAQTDYFCFTGPSTFRVYMWDMRKDSSTRLTRMVVEAGESDPMVVIVPPGVVHGYLNVGAVDGLVVNCPDRLFMGKGKKEAVDETRYEDLPDSPYVME